MSISLLHRKGQRCTYRLTLRQVEGQDLSPDLHLCCTIAGLRQHTGFHGLAGRLGQGAQTGTGHGQRDRRKLGRYAHRPGDSSHVMWLRRV
jgi:hypothetical protein